MDTFIQRDEQELKTNLDQVQDIALHYFEQIHQRPTTSEAKFVPATTLTSKGKGTQATIEHFMQHLDPLFVASGGPRYWGFVTGGVTPAALVGDWLTSVYDANPQATKGQGDVSAQIETESLQLLLDLLRLPLHFLGGFVTGATMSNFTCLATARQWIGLQQGIDIARAGMRKPISVWSATAHSSVFKFLSLLGIGSASLFKLKTLEGNREAIDCNDLEENIKATQGKPFILVSNAGTVNSGDFDDFERIAQLHKKYRFWWHIDAAFGAFAACTQSHQHLLKAWENADSIALDCHKWLNVPYESAVFFIQEKHALLQVASFQNSNAPYLNNKAQDFNYLHFLPENSRRLKALPTWFSLMAYGKNGICEIINNSIQMAALFAKNLEETATFQLLAPVRLNIVCFTLKNKDADFVLLFLKALNQNKKVFMSPTIYKGQQAIRAAFVNWRTSAEDIHIVIQEMLSFANSLSL